MKMIINPKMTALLVVVALALLVTVTVNACKPSGKEPHKPAPAPDSKEKPIGMNPEVADSDSIVSFRYVRFERNNKSMVSGVYTLKKDKSGTYLYYRAFGNWQGWSYFDVPVDKELSELDAFVRSLKLSDYQFVSKDDVDESRPRREIEAKYASGAVVSAVQYDGDKEMAALAAADTVVPPMFKALVSMVETMDPKPGEYSCYTYDSKGKLRQRIDYTNDGIVHGGYDADNPLATF